MLPSFLTTSAPGWFQQADEHAFTLAPLTEPGFNPGLDAPRKIKFRDGSENNQVGERCLFRRGFG